VIYQKIEEKNGKVKARYFKELGHVDIMTGFTRPLRKQKLVDDVGSFILSVTKNNKEREKVKL
jgi:hypothetical protein